MLRNFLADRHVGSQPDFRWRGTDVSRMEGFSDGVFGFALTLLVVSLDVPDNYTQLVAAMRNTPSFAICFLLLMLVWYSHYRFFRRYGLEDPLTMSINAVLLFVVLIYIYPLKFLFTLLTDQLLGIDTMLSQPDGSLAPPILDSQWPGLLMIYAAGYVAINVCFLLLFVNAWHRRATLELTPLEQLETGASILDQVANIGVGVIAFTFAAFGNAGLAGLSFALQWPLGWLRNRVIDRQRLALNEQATSGAAPAPSSKPSGNS